MIGIQDTPYSYEELQDLHSQSLFRRVGEMRSEGKLSPKALYRMRKFFRIKSIYHSNAIEGNHLGVEETRQVVELGLKITGKPLKDQAEARNLSHALDYSEEVALGSDRQIAEFEIRQLHSLVLDGVWQKKRKFSVTY